MEKEIKKSEDSQIDYHLKRVKSIISNDFDKQKGKLMADVFIRKTGAYFNPKNENEFIINKEDLYNWFENLDYLKQYSQFDTI